MKKDTNRRSWKSSAAIIGIFAAIVIAENVYPRATIQMQESSGWQSALNNITNLLAAVSARENNKLAVVVWAKGAATDSAKSYVQVPLGSAVAEIGFQAVGAKTCRVYNGATQVTTWDTTKTSDIQSNWNPGKALKVVRRVVCTDGINSVEDQAIIIVGKPESESVIRCAPLELGITAGGSNFNLSSVGTFNEKRVLLDDSVKPPFIEILTNPVKVKAQLQKMYDSGQRKITTLIWHAPLRGIHADKTHVGYLVNSKGGLKPEIIRGLEAYYTAVREVGFTDLVFRAGLQSCSAPHMWVPNNTIACPTSYSTEIENDNFTVILQVHAAADKVFAGSTVKRWYDLYGEGIGYDEPAPTYNKRIWKRYTTKFGTADTYGFSIAYGEGRLAKAYQIYDFVGKRPPVIAVDVYDSHEGGPPMASTLAALGREMQQLNLTATPVVIQETYYNHAPSFTAISNFVKTYGIKVAAIYQWPTDKSDIWLDTPYLYSAYCPALPTATSPTTPTVQAWIRNAQGTVSKEMTIKVGTRIPEIGFQAKDATSCKVYNGPKEYAPFSGLTERRAPFVASATPWTLVQTYRCTNGKTTAETSITINIIK
ncbi:MAG: hypothetical protein WAZ27_03590 [Minisyncoccia bacterium]